MGSLDPPAVLTPNIGHPPVAEMIGTVFELADLRPATRKTYEYAAKNFTAWAGGLPLSPTILVAYKNYLRGNVALSAKTRNLYLSAVRTVFRQLFISGVLPFDASKMVRSFAVDTAHKRPPISDAQVGRAYTYATKSGDTRLVLILNLLLRQGLRQKEVIDLCVEHFNEEAMTLAVLGKGRDDRETIHLHPATARCIRAHIDSHSIKHGYLFPSRKHPGRHIRTVTVYRMIQHMHKCCRITNSPHSWRKVFTSKLIESGMNLLDLTVAQFRGPEIS